MDGTLIAKKYGLMNGSGGGGGGSYTKPVSMRPESIFSRNDINSINISFTAKKTSSYMLLIVFANISLLPVFTTENITVNGDAVELDDYFITENLGVSAKYVSLNLNAGDVVSVDVASNVASSNTSGFAALIKTSKMISNVVSIASIVSTSGGGYEEINQPIVDNGNYMAVAFYRLSGVDTLAYTYLNDEDMRNDIVNVSSGNSWQVCGSICPISAKSGDEIDTAANKGNYLSSCGILKFNVS